MRPMCPGPVPIRTPEAPSRGPAPAWPARTGLCPGCTGRRVRSDVPKSPVTAFCRNVTYWTGSGWSYPSSWRTRSTTAAGAEPPTIARIGSAGRTARIANTAIDRAKRTPTRDRTPEPDFRSRGHFGHNLLAMNVESRDSVSLKPAELDEFGQLLLAATGSPIGRRGARPPGRSIPARRRRDARRRAPGRHARLARTHRRHAVDPVGARRRAQGQAAPAATLKVDDRRAVAPGRDLVPRRGRARRDPALRSRAATRCSQSYANVVPRPGLHAERRGPRVGSPAREALRRSNRTSTTVRSRVAVKGRKPPCVPVLDASPVKAIGRRQDRVARR